MGRKRGGRGFGYVRKLPSRRYQASYAGPDQQRHNAPVTFETVKDAESWLGDENRLIASGNWSSPAARAKAAAEAAEAEAAPPPVVITLREFVNNDWLPDLDVRISTRRDYESLLRNHVLPTLGALPLEAITKPVVRRWWASLDPSTPRARSKAFQLLHSIMAGALDLELIDVNPVILPTKTRVRTKRVKVIEPLTIDQVNTIADNMPARLRMAVLLGCWCALRYGELAELRRHDVDMESGTITITRGMTKVIGGYLVGQPKTDAGQRTIHVPDALLPELRVHLREHTAWGREGLLFPATNGGHMHSTTFARYFSKAAAAAGRPDATPHTLRHTGASLATAAGATIPDVMARLGHTTPTMAMVYQHALSGADARVGRSLSQMMEASS